MDADDVDAGAGAGCKFELDDVEATPLGGARVGSTKHRV